MQDEPVGVTTEQLPPSAEDNDCSTVSKSEQTPNNHVRIADYEHRNHESGFDRGRFVPVPTLCDLQHSRQTHQQSSQRPELGHAAFGHLTQRKPFSHPDPRCSPVEEAEADASSPSPTSVNPNEIQMDSPVAHHINNGNGSGGSSSTGNMLSGGLGAGFPNLPTQEMQSAERASSPSLPGFGTPWSVQTSSSPPPASTSIHAINPMPSTDSDNSFYPGIPSSINPAFFQSFSANPCAGINVQGFSGPFSPQINVPQQPQSRRSPVSPQMHHQQGAFLQQRNNYNQHQVS